MQVADKFSRIIERLVPEGNLDLKMRTILLNEVRRRLAEFEAVDRRFRQKYGMTLDEFERRGVVKERGYASEVERDHQEWDAAVDAMRTLRADLDELER
jgi:hypothetical protein